MTKREFERLQTPVMLRDKESATDATNYFRVVKITCKLPALYVVNSKWAELYLDLYISKISNTRGSIHFYSKPVPLGSPPLERFTAIPWPQAKREILDLLLGQQQ